MASKNTWGKKSTYEAVILTKFQNFAEKGVVTQAQSQIFGPSLYKQQNYLQNTTYQM